MIEIEMPGDIKDFKPKVIGSLTVRQTVCFGLGGLLGIGAYMLLKGTSIAAYAVLLVAAIPVLCGVWAPYDIPLEQYALMWFLEYKLPPKHRKYETENEFLECFEVESDEEIREKILRSRKKKKKNRRSKNEDIIDYK